MSLDCGSAAAGGPYVPGMPNPGYQPAGIPVPPGAGFAVPGTLVGKDVNYDGMIQRNEMGFIAGGGGGGFPDNGEDCTRTITTFKTVQVPCTRNRYKVVNYQVPKQVPYTDFVTVTKMRNQTKMVPATKYITVPEVVPYQTQVPVTKYKTIQIPKSRQECYPVTSIVKKQIPVVTVMPAGPPPPCPPPETLNPGCNVPTPLPMPMPGMPMPGGDCGY